MRYVIVSGLVLAAVQLAFLPPAASARSSASLDSFSLAPMTRQSTTTSKPQTLDKIVAVVNDGVILESELDAEVAQVRQQSGGRAGQMPRNALRSQVLDHMIMQRLQVQRAKQDGIKVSKDEVNQGLGRIAQKNGMNMQQFTQAVANSGMSMQDLRQQVRQEILISKLRRQEVMSKVVVTDKDVDRYLENQSLRNQDSHQYHLRQIVIHLPAGATNSATHAARQQAEDLRQRIASGKADFASAARSQSQGPHAASGGDMGWMADSSLPDMYSNILSGMKPGDISPVLRGPDGFYLVQLEGERAGNSNNGGSAGDNQASSQKVIVQQVKMRHILLKPNEIRDDQRTRKLASQIHQRLEAGDDFAALARKYSDDSATSNQGGELGWVPVAELQPGTQQKISDLKKGQISPVFQDPSGYEIVKLEGRRQHDETEQARRNKARQALGEQRSSEQGQLWLRKLRDEAYVDIRMPDYQPPSGH